MANTPHTKPRKLAVVIFNLGGPDSPEAVRPFLLNLFNDPAILRLPNPLRWAAARVITARRAAATTGIYEQVGGKSTLLPATIEQAEALKKEIADTAEQVEVFVFMRYWRPLVSETVARIRDFGPDRIVLLPLYPQFSTTTTGTSVKAFREEARKQGLTAPQDVVCCYPAHHGFLDATTPNIRQALDEASAHGAPRRRGGRPGSGRSYRLCFGTCRNTGGNRHGPARSRFRYRGSVLYPLPGRSRGLRLHSRSGRARSRRAGKRRGGFGYRLTPLPRALRRLPEHALGVPPGNEGFQPSREGRMPSFPMLPWRVPPGNEGFQPSREGRMPSFPMLPWRVPPGNEGFQPSREGRMPSFPAYGVAGA